MSLELFWTYAFNFIFNSFFVFFTSLLLCKLVAFIFCIKQPRLKALLFCVPFLKLILDGFLYYDTSNWALFHSVDPRFAAENSRSFGAAIGFFPYMIPSLQFSMEGHALFFTLADLLALTMGASWTMAVVLSISSLSFLKGIYFFLKLRRSKKEINKLLRHSISISKEVALSSHIAVPCAVGVFKRKILFPKHLMSKLSLAEFNAVLAHEKSHLVWHDALVRLVMQFFAAMFWWIPTNKTLKKIENWQEEACDQVGKNSLELASALVKVARFTNQQPVGVAVLCFVSQSDVSRRIQLLLKEEKPQMFILKWVQRAAIAFMALGIILGVFWIF